jgi:hypothetical protein
MVDSRVKGRTAELNCRNELRKLTSLEWERTPLSGALSAKHKLKGDLYIPDTRLKYCVEVKHYADDHINTKLLTGTNPQFLIWWDQTVEAANKVAKEPLLIFKHNRSKWFTAFYDYDIQLKLMDSQYKHLMLSPENITICLLTIFCKFAEFEE